MFKRNLTDFCGWTQPNVGDRSLSNSKLAVALVYNINREEQKREENRKKRIRDKEGALNLPYKSHAGIALCKICGMFEN